MPEIIELITEPRPDNLNIVTEILQHAASGDFSYFHSPPDWRDEILYFLLPDRFSDGLENDRSLLSLTEIQQKRKETNRTDIHWGNWAESGKRWQGGTISGILSKLDYLQKLGITALWIAPLFKQRAKKDTYHGYGIQDFLDTDPRFGTRAELLDLVQKAHAKGIRVILDVIINHSGDNWGYLQPGSAPAKVASFIPYKHFPDYYGNPLREDSKGWSICWRNAEEITFTTNSSEIRNSDEGVWPRELQEESIYTRAGMGSLDDNDLGNPHAIHKRTDFYDLKDFALDNPLTLSHLVECFKYWIAISDCDGFRIDTIKHISLEDARNFCGAILEFAETIGKRNFLLAGEIAGGDGNQDYVLDYTALLQRNLKAALDIGNARTELQAVGKGYAPGSVYLETFKAESTGFDSHRSFGNRHISILDDHDHATGDKLRFSASVPDNSAVKDYAIVAPTAIQLFTLGIPCIYYGSEQGFAGPPQSQIQYTPGWNNSRDWGDRYLRETMFGADHPRASHANDLQTQLMQNDTTIPGFAAFGITGKHCFNSDHPAYIRIAALCNTRKRFLTLRKGRQYTRQTSVIGKPFSFPDSNELIAWSRILDDEEILCVVNPCIGNDPFRGADIIIASEIFKAGEKFRVVLNTAQAAAEAAGQTYNGTHPMGSVANMRAYDNGIISVIIREIHRSEVVVFQKEAAG